MSDDIELSETCEEFDNSGRHNSRYSHQQNPSLETTLDDSRILLNPKFVDITMAQKMMSACSGSLLTSLVVTPFDVVRVRLQQQGAFPIDAATKLAQQKLTSVTPRPTTIPVGIGINTCCKNEFWFPSTIDYCVASELDICAKDEAVKRRFTGTWEGLKKISQYEGFQALWRGLGLTLIMSIPSNVVYFIGYEYLRDNSPIQHPIFTPLLAGGFARTLAATVVSPIELIKTRLQSVSSVSRGEALKNVMRGINEMVASQGIISLWRGLVLTLWRDVPFSAIYWTAVEIIREKLSKTEYIQTHPEHKFLESFTAGCVGGSIAAICTSPFDVGKTRRQVGHHTSASSKMGMVPLLRNIAKNEGIPALFVGAVPRVLKIAPACAIMITSYETGKRVFKQYNSLQ